MHQALSAEEQPIWSDVLVLLLSHLPVDAPASAEADFAIQRLRRRMQEAPLTPQEQRLWGSAYAAALILRFPMDINNEMRREAEKHADYAIKALRARGPAKAENEQPNRHQCNATRALDKYRRLARELLPPTDADRDDIEEALTRLRPPRYSAQLARLFLRSEILECPENHAASCEGLYWRVMSILAQVGDMNEDGHLSPLKTGMLHSLNMDGSEAVDPLSKPTKDFAKKLVAEALARLEGL